MNNKFKRVLAIVLMLSIVIGILPARSFAESEPQVIIGWNDGQGIILNSTTPYWTNGSDEATSNEEDYNAYFDSKTKTLTLNNAVIKDYYMAPTNRFAVGIYSTGSLNIILKGSNIVDLSGIEFPKHDLYYDSNGILILTSLTIDSEPGGSLTSKGGNVRYTSAVFNNGKSSGIRSDSIIINSGEILSVGGAANLKSNGLYTGYGADLRINGGKVTAIGGEVDYIPGLVNGSYGESSTRGESSIQFDGGEFIAIGHNWGILNTFYDSGLEIFVSKNYDGSNLEKYGKYERENHKNKYSLGPFYKYFKVTHGSIANPNAIAKVKSLIQGETYEVQQAVANNEYLAKYKIESLISQLALDGVATEVVKKSYTPAIAGTKENPNGTNGNYTCTVKLSKGNSKDETDEFTMRIIATVYSIDEVGKVIDLINKLPGVIDRGHEKEVKEALIEYDKLPEGKKPLVTNFKKLVESELVLIRLAIDGGTVYVKSNATQEDKTKAVKQYVDEFLELNCPDVTGEVYYYYNGPYKVSLSKGSYSNGPEIIKMIIIEGEESTLTQVTEVTITGTPEVGKTLTALVDPVDATVNYEWHSGGKPVGTNSKEYKVQESDLGKLITVKVTGTGKFTGSTASEGTKIIPIIEKTYEIEGTVKDKNNNLVDGATVKLMSGQKQVGSSTETDEDGKFKIQNIKPGTYNLVISKEGQVVTTIVSIKNSNFAVGEVRLPIGKTNSIIEVKSNTPDVIVGGLDKQFETVTSEVYKGVTAADMEVVINGGLVEIKLTVETKDNNALNADKITNAAKDNGKKIGSFIDLTVKKIVIPFESDRTETTLVELSNLIDVYIPLDESLRGKDQYVVYRYHGDSVDTITTSPNADGEKIEIIDSNTIKLTVKKFSIYAIAYNDEVIQPTPDMDDDNGSNSGNNNNDNTRDKTTEKDKVEPKIEIEQTSGGKITISDLDGSKNGNRNVTITPDKGYVIADVMIDGISMGAVENYKFTDSKDHKVEVKFVKVNGLPYYFENQQRVYIGFSNIIGNVYKYIAPNGKVVEFRDNPKSFIDNTIEWAKKSIDFVTEREIFVGTKENVFSPNEDMTRAMFVTVVGRLYERSYGNITGNNTFSDVNENAYYGKYVAWAHKNDIIKGIGENKFAPNDMVTREQMAVIMLNFAKFLNNVEASNVSLKYNDSGSISSWAIDGAKYCQEKELITGSKEGDFLPKGNASRAEVAAVIERFVKAVVSK